MTVPYFTNDQMIEYMKQNGWELVSSDFWDENNTLIYAKNDALFHFHYDTTRVYHYTAVVKLCSILKIQPPAEHIRQYYLHHRKQEEVCYCGKPQLFKDCCGKD